MSDIEHIQGWKPHSPSCHSCVYYDEGIEHGDYGQILSVDPNCVSLRANQDDLPGFPFDEAPLNCLEEGRYALDAYYAFFQSPFSEGMDGTEESMQKAFDGFIWWLENIRAVGV